MPVTARHGYRVRRTVLRDQDVAEAERITQMLKSEGWTHANHSYVMRSAMVCLRDSLRGKSAEETVRFFIFLERMQRREQLRPKEGG